MARRSSKRSRPTIRSRKQPNAPAKKRGAPKKTSAAALAKVDQLFSQLDISKQAQSELLSIVAKMFCEGSSPTQIKDKLGKPGAYPEYQKLFSRTSVWNLLIKAAHKKMMTHTPPEGDLCKAAIIRKYRWLDEHSVSVVSSVHQEGLAYRAATELLRLIRDVSRQHEKEVHVGFAGGRTLRCVAARLAQLLTEPHPDNPQTLFLHAMVAPFDDEDFYADPNSFITYFVGDQLSIPRVKFIRLPLPGIVESELFDAVCEMGVVKDVFGQAKDLQIIVTSGSLWSEEHSTLREYFHAAQHHCQTTETGQARDLIESFMRENEIIGDMLWQPINKLGPVDLELPFKIPTLVHLAELPEFIARGGHVLLVMGCSGVTNSPKSLLLRTILDLDERLCTNLVSDTPTVRGVF